MKYGITYMGSKSDIVASIAMNFPKAENFYDLFGGGMSMTHYLAAKRPNAFKNLYYNDLNPGLAELLQKAIAGEYGEGYKMPWVSRDEFHAKKSQDAFIRILWSFGNNQKGYLFAPGIEAYKKSAHMAVVFDEFDKTAISVLGFDKWPFYVSTQKQKRLFWRKKVAFNHKEMSRSEREQLRRLEQLEQLERLQQLKQLQQLESLERLGGLKKLNSLQNPKLFFSAKDYRQVEILPNSVVYCDIPYKGTAEYTVKFDHESFYRWAESASFPVFFSEYGACDKRFKLVYQVAKMVKLAPKGATKENAVKGREKLFWNGV